MSGIAEKNQSELSPRMKKKSFKEIPKPTQSPSFKQLHDVPSSPPIQKKRTAKTNVF